MLGIYGGTFDPIHFGHLRTALEVKESARLDEVHFVPCHIPPHRVSPGAAPGLRLRMLTAALADAPPGFRVDTRELDRPGPSYMVDTLSSIRTDIGANPLCLIVGWDAFCGIPGWHRWHRLFELAHLIVMLRPGASSGIPTELNGLWQERLRNDSAELRERPAGLFFCVRVTMLDISATRIRQSVAKGCSARYLTPDPVLGIIAAENLYR
jgi:nicotinate-nucleotide adenylyltransferase